ncbi:MAG: TetR/AcrR family transcriptional regulator [Novosphingobium sp.]|nr:TetR/AcrR family transcriptional regulator [Novosphingobium sp.]
MIDTAVRLVSEKGAEAISVAAIAREMGINRTTVYYHFPSREALIDAAKDWASEQLALGMDVGVTQPERIAQISRFVLENPELIKLWIDDFVSGDDIRHSYKRWDDIVAGLSARFAERFPDSDFDAEVYCVMMLSAAIIGPRILSRSVSPGDSIDRIVERFTREHQRTLERDGLIQRDSG